MVRHYNELYRNPKKIVSRVIWLRLCPSEMSNSHLLLQISDEEEQSRSANVYRRFQRYWSNQFEPSPPMSPMERETLNPCEKLRRFGKIPWKLSIHALLVIATTLMVHIWSQNDSLHIRHSFSQFHRVLLGVSGSLPSERFVEVATADELKLKLDSAVEGYWSIGESKFSNYSLCKDPLIIEVVSEGSVTESIPLDRNTWKTNPEYQRVTSDVSSAVRSFDIYGVLHDRFEGTHFQQCLRWSLDVKFDFGGTGLMVGSLNHRVAECSKDGSTNVTVPCVVMALALLSAILCAKAEYSRRRRDMVAYLQGSVSGWFITNLVANVIQIAAGIACLRLAYRMDVETRFTLIGLAAVTAWICVLRYLRYFHIYYLLVKTLSRAVPKCLRFVTGVFPILVGYALLGTCLFHQSPLFASIGASVATLFSLLNGDIIRDTFSDICQLRPGWGEVYLYSFLCLFIYVVLHLFISIVEEAYFSAAKHQDTPSEAFTQIEMTEATDGVDPLLSDRPKSEIARVVISSICDQLQSLKNSGNLDRHSKLQLVSLLNS